MEKDAGLLELDANLKFFQKNHNVFAPKFYLKSNVFAPKKIVWCKNVTEIAINDLVLFETVLDHFNNLEMIRKQFIVIRITIEENEHVEE